ncbi:hypothetical protein ACO0QE_002446 [Hanseniaspora vineae]
MQPSSLLYRAFIRSPAKNKFAKTSSIESLLPRQTRQKAWEKTGEDKESFFKRKHAHHHAREKQIKQERLQRQQEKQVEREKKHELLAKSYSSVNNDYGRGDKNSKYQSFKPRNSFESSSNFRKEPESNSFFTYIYGTNSVRAALMKRDPKNHNRVFYLGGIPHDIEQLCESKQVGTHEAQGKDFLNNLCKGTGSSRASAGKVVHNNLVLETKKIGYPVISGLPDAQADEGVAVKSFQINDVSVPCHNKTHPVGLYLDEVHDPHNMGAIIRSAYYLGIDFIVVSGRNCCNLTSSTLHKASCGAIEMIPIFTCDKPLSFLQDARAKDWLLISGQMRTAHKAKKHVEFDDLNAMIKPKLLIVGNEGEGIRTNLLNMSDYFVSIDPAENTDTSLVDSLNVSVATALLISKMCK